MSFVTVRRLPILAALGAVLATACSSGGDSSASGAPTVTPLPSVAGDGAAQAHLAVDEHGGVLMSWLEPHDGNHALEFARFEDGRWGEPVRVAQGSDWFINWADFPSVVPMAGATWSAHWLVSIPDSYAYNAVTSLSHDAGRSWSDPVVLNEDGTETEHGFVTLFPWEGDIGAVWLDGRRLDQWTFEKELAAEIPLGVSLYYVRMDTTGRVLERGEIDELVCDCCQPDVAMTADGPVLVYRDRTAEEIRDIVVRRYADGGWTPIVQAGPDHFEIDGCPVNGPTADARGEELVVAWFTAPGNEPKVRLARSSDAGRSFAPAIDIDAQGAFGQTDVVLLEDSSAIVSWWRRGAAGGLALVARRVGADGTLGPVLTVAESQVPQPLDVPQMVRAGDGLLFAWTGIDAQAGIHTIYVTGL